MFDALLADLRFAFRLLRKDPAFSAIAVATLALGIGANTAVLSLVDAVILRPLAYTEPGRLVSIHEVVPRFSHLAPLIPVNAMHYKEWSKSARSFEQITLVGGIALNLTGSGEPERLRGARATANLFPMLGVHAQLGRTFLAEEDQPGRDSVVVLNDELWRRRFGADPSVIGRKVTFDGGTYEIVGVLPREFRFPKLSQLFAMTIDEEQPEIWKPFALRDSDLSPMGDFNYVSIARLRTGVTRSQALAELNGLQSSIASGFPEKTELRAAIVPLQDQIVGRSRGGLQLMLAAVAAVLLIACVNIANLLLARAAGRRREIAIRTAIGAAPRRLVRQVLVESLLLSGIGGICGVAVAFGAMRLILARAPLDIPRLDEVHPDARLLLFNFALALAAGLLFGLLPAWRFARTDPQEAMRSGGRGTTAGRGAGRLRSLLVALEVGLSAMCLIAGGLLLHSFVKLLHVDRGFNSDRVLVVDLNLPQRGYPNTQKRAAFIQATIERVAAVPGVSSVGISNKLPLTGEGGNNLILPEGRNLAVMERPLSDLRQVNPDYFRTMGIPLRAGRLFAEADRNHPVALLSTLTAERIWPNQNPVGKRFRTGGDDTPLIEIIGVVGDVHGVSLSRTPSNTIYFPYWQRSFNQYALVVRTAMDPRSATSPVRAAIRQVDPDLPIPTIRTMEAVVDASVAQRRFQMTLVLLFAITALLLASLGIYGVISYSVAQRTSEMGIRLALGAQPALIRAMVLRQGMQPVILGLTAGVLGALLLGRLLATLLFDVTPTDPLTIVVVAALLLSVAAGATYLPARRATRVDPTALRYE
ncbi:MAG: ABC transporter permease [Acidobacteriia bacterium]|nr:ABC transporter permease [Terriglobia bacterium]